MLPEDVHFLFSAREEYVDLVLTLELEIDYEDTTIVGSLNRLDSQGYIPSLPDTTCGVEAEEPEGRVQEAEADSAAYSLDFKDGNAERDSQRHRG
jgi:hypothetical protein